MNILGTVRPKIVQLPTRQKTIQKPIHYCGIHPFKHTKNTLILYPAPENSGIVIKLGGYLFRLSPLHVDYSSEDGYSTLIVGDQRLTYVEHLFASLLGLGITNIIIDIPDGEIPIIDGSAKLYTQLIVHAGIVEQQSFQTGISFENDTILCSDEGEGIIHINKSDELSIISTDNFNGPFGLQSALFRQKTTNFVAEFSVAREFLKQSINPLQLSDWSNHRHDLIHPYFQDRDGMIAYCEDTLLSSLHVSNEPAKHQIIDILGCIQMLGMPLVGSFKCYKPSQSLIRSLIQKIYSSIPAIELRTYLQYSNHILSDQTAHK